MPPTAIIAITALISFFFILTLASTLALVYLLYRLHSRVNIFLASITRLETAISSLPAAIGATIKPITDSLYAKIQSIDGHSLTEAARISITAATRIEKISILLNELARTLFSEEVLHEISQDGIERARRAGLGAEAFAPDNPTGVLYSTRSSAAELDDKAKSQEGEFNSLSRTFATGIADGDGDGDGDDILLPGNEPG